jgi:phage repressor protein C with HTH and peptisase S24 domain
MNIIDRIKALLTHRGIKPRNMRSELSKACGISYQAVSQWFSGETANIKNDNLAAIAETYGSSVDWLLTGKGEMLSEPAPARLDGSNVVSLRSKGRSANGELSIPLYNVRAAMGHGQVPAEYIETVRHLTIHETHLVNRGIAFTKAENLAVITGWGQSMEGTINDGDPVIIDHGINEFIGDGVYVFSWDNLLYIKRLQKHSLAQFDMISDNSKHKDQVVEVSDVRIHARVLLVWNEKKL